MSGIYYVNFPIDKWNVSVLPKEKLDEIVTIEALRHMKKDIRSLMTIEQEEHPEFNVTEYKASIAILSVVEYKRLKAIEAEYRRTMEYQGWYKESAEWK